MTLSVGGVTLTRRRRVAADVTGDSADVAKTFVDANISIAASATNEVGTSHSFTVTVQKNVGLGGLFVAASGEHVDVHAH